MNDKTLGLVLKQTDYKEYDALISVLTKDFGLLTFVAKSVRKPQSKNIGALYPFSISEFLFDYLENKDMFALHSATLQNSCKNIQTNLVKTAIANLMSELTITIAKDEELGSELYNLLEACLIYLDKTSDMYLPLCLYMAKILDYLGISPEVDECCNCGSSKVNAISVDDGGFVCSSCSTLKPLDPNFLRQFRLLNKANYDNLEVLAKFGPYPFSQVEYFYSFLNTYLSINLKSMTFLNEVINM